MIHASLFSKPPGAASVPFGIDAKNSAAALRHIADDIENQVVFLQKVEAVSEADGDDWTKTYLVLSLVEKVEKKEQA